MYLYLSWFGCNSNGQFSTALPPHSPLWPQPHITAQSLRCPAFPCQSLLVLLCTVLALARRKLLRRPSKQRSLCTCFVQLNPTISSFSLLFSQSIIVTSFKWQIIGITPVRCRFRLQSTSFISFEPSIIKANKFHSSKGDACDVENFSEYDDVVKKVLKLQPTKAITVFVDMKDVNHAAKKVCASAILGDI